HQRGPLLDIRLFRHRAFGAGNVAGLLSYAILFGVFFLLPFAFERIYRESSLGAGLRLAVIPVVLGCVAPLSGGLSDRLGSRLLSLSRSFGTTVGIALAATVLSRQLASLTGRSGDTLHAPPHDLLVAVHTVIAALGGCALLAAGASLIGGRRPK